MDQKIADQGARPLGGDALVKVGVVVVGLAVIIAFGLELVAPSYDSLYSLAWGQLLADGQRPEIFHPLAPLAHPLPIAIGAVLSPLGPYAAYLAFTILAAFSFAFLLYAAARLARAVLGSEARDPAPIAVAVLVGVLMLTRVRIDLFAMKATVDVPFAGLVLLALAFVIEQPRSRPWLPLALLVPAGLLRPESWGLGLVYCLWLGYQGLRGRKLAACVALALAPIAGWLLFAGIVAKDALSPLTGNPQGTSVDVFGFTPPDTDDSGGFWLNDTAEILDRTIDNTRALIGDELAIVAYIAIVAVLLPMVIPRNRTPFRLRFAFVTAVGVGLVLQAVILGHLGAPVAERYGMVVAVSMIVLAGVAIWQIPVTKQAIAASVLLVLITMTAALSGPFPPSSPTLPRVREKVALQHGQRNEHEDLYALTANDRVRKAVRPCNKLKIGGRGGIYATLFAKPLIAHGLEKDPQLVAAERSPRGKLTASNFRRALHNGPKPYVEEGLWVFRSPCLKKGYINPRGKISKRYRQPAGSPG